MYTIYEATPFTRVWQDYWSEEEHGEFCRFLSENPEAGNVVPKSGGVRKVRWSQSGGGKSGGVRVIYYCRLEHGHIWLMTIYGKASVENIPAHILKKLKESIEHGDG